MKLATPKHILREYERLMRGVYRSPCIEIKGIDEEAYVEKACQRLKKAYTPREAIQLLREMVGYLEVVNLEPNLFYKSTVRKDLVLALKKHPAKEEAKEILDFIDGAAQFKWSWGQLDAESKVRRFRRASKKVWEALCKNEYAEICKKSGNIRVLYLEVDPQFPKIVEKVKAELGKEFWKNFKYWRIWFNLRIEGHYYFYWD